MFSGNGETKEQNVSDVTGLGYLPIPISSTITFGFKLDDISGSKMIDDHGFVAVVYRKG